MKMPIEFHEDNLKNRKRNIERMEEDLAVFKLRIACSKKDIDFLSLQVEEAKKQGKDGFDDERFLIKRKPAVLIVQ